MRRYTGATLATYTLYAQTQAWYTYQGPVGSLVHPDGTTQTTFSYDLAGRLTSASDPDSGTWHYTYDLDGNVTQQTDARGTNVYAAYDGLDRLLWQSANADGTSPLATYAYDDTTAGNQGIGRLTTEGYASGPSQSVTGTYSYVYDGRGRPTSTSLTIQGPGAPSATYTVGTSYDDADRPVTMSLPATGDLPAEALTYAYNDGTDGGLSSLTSSLTVPTATLFQSPTYTSQGLLNGWKAGVTSGNPAWQASVSLGYDGDLRVSDSTLTRTDTISGLSLPIAEVQPSYDAAGNVSSVTTTLAAVGSTPGGSETQAFCYDDLDRLTWAGTSGTGPCGRAGSEGIAGAGYTASYAYDTFDRITSASVLNSSGVALPNAAQGTYSYGASGHLHAVSWVGSGATGYSAAYDAAGDMTCRAVGASTCTNASPTGQQLGYDALRRLISWQDAATSPTATGAFAYDGSGSRVWQQDTSTSGGVTTTTTTTYILGFAEITSVQTGQAASNTTATRYYPLAGGVSALRDAAGLSYVASDQLGTPIATLNLDTGAVLGEQLRTPYGQARYAANSGTNGGMHTTFGFTGQREDASAAGSSGLDYFNARYYDPAVGRFTSADPYVGADALLDNYAYVGGNPDTLTDPSGHFPDPGDGEMGPEDVLRLIVFLTNMAINFLSHSGAPLPPSTTTPAAVQNIIQTLSRFLDPKATNPSDEPGMPDPSDNMGKDDMGGDSTSGSNPTRPTDSLRRILQEKNAPKGSGPPKNDDGGKTGPKGGGSNNPNIIRGPSGGYRRYYESQSAAGLGTSSSASSTAQGSPDWIQIAVRPHVKAGVGIGISSDGPLPDALGLFNSITSQIGGAIVSGGQQIATGVGNAASTVGNWWDNFLNSPPGWGQPDCACGGGPDGGDDNDLPDGLPDDELAPGI